MVGVRSVAFFIRGNHCFDLVAERDAMGDDDYHPIGKAGSNLTKAGGIGYTVIDSIDTMQLMGLDEEYTRARAWVATKLSFDRDANFNTFEVQRGFYSNQYLSRAKLNKYRPRFAY